MTDHNPPPPDDPQQLRRRAEELAAEQVQQQDLPRPEQLPQLVHELRVHQIELEMQNESLRRTQSELESSRDRYADLYDFAPVGYVTLDAQGIIHEINLTACGMLGRERHRLPGTRLASFVANREKSRLREHLAQCSQTRAGAEVTTELTLPTDDPNELPVLLRTVAAVDPQTGERQYRMAIMDVTERKRAEQELRHALAKAEEGERLLNALMDHVPEGITIADAPDVKIRRVSRAGQRLIGKPSAALEGIPAGEHADKWGIFCSDGVTPARDEDLPLTRAVRKGEVVTGEEWVLRNPDGRQFQLLCNAAPIRDAHGQIVSGVIAWRDITERKRAEKSLRELNETLEQQVIERTSALAMLRDIASMANRAQDVEQALKYCLRRVSEHNGWTFGHAYLPADTDPDLLLPAYTWYAAEAERFQAFRELTLQTSLRRGDGLPGSVFHSAKPGWMTDIQAELDVRRLGLAADLGLATAAAFPIMAENRVVGVLEFFSDKAIEPRAEMLESMAAVGLQLGRVVERKAFQDHLLTVADEQHRRIGQELHDDVGQEMTGLALQAETLARMIATEDTPAGKLAERIRRAAARTQHKTQALSRGLVPMDIEAPGLEGALDGLARRTDESKGISCRFRHRGDGRVADSQAATQLYRIAQEAVANAVRHSEARQIDITLSNDKQGTVLEIHDNGRGLPREKQTPGMGLQIMSYRAKLAGGTLTVESPPTGGTRVTCRVNSCRERPPRRSGT